MNATRAAHRLAALTASNTLTDVAHEHVVSRDASKLGDSAAYPNSTDSAWFFYGEGILLDHAHLDTMLDGIGGMKSDAALMGTMLRADLHTIGIGLQFGSWRGYPTIWADLLYQ